jgi:tRNA(Ile)-lysidine synthase
MAARGRIQWRTCAEALAAVIPRTRLHREVCDWAGKQPAGPPWLVGFSGGSDSLALLLLLWAHWPERRRKMVAAHFNHRLRGAAANADEKFCAEVCRQLGVKFVRGEWSDRPAKISEAAARNVRRDFFREVCRRTGARAIWLGHQLDDIAETLLMRIARGSGSGGLAAPRPVHPHRDDLVHVRPLLDLEKQEIARALKTVGARWREDRTNETADFFRNRVRRAVLPAWRKATVERNPLLGAAITRARLAEDDAALDAWLMLLAPITKRGELNLRRLAGKPRAIVRRALHAWLQHNECGAGLSRQAFEALLDDVQQHRRTRHSLDAQHLAEIGRRTAKIVLVPAKNSA